MFLDRDKAPFAVSARKKGRRVGRDGRRSISPDRLSHSFGLS